MTVTKNQQHIIDLMKQGWELGQSMSIDGGAWIQKGGCGHGGETERVNAHTLHSLQNKGIIETKESKFPLKTFKLIINPR